MSNDKYYIPKYTDDPERFLLCTIDELFAGSVCFMSFAWMGHTVIGATAMVAAILVVKRVKGSFFKDGLDAFLYWHLPAVSPLDKHLPKSCDREYLG